MEQVIVVNIKCGGCMASIKSALEKKDYKNINIDLGKQSVSFEGDRQQAKQILSDMGYPEAGSREAESLLKKTKSYVSCATGKFKQ